LHIDADETESTDDLAGWAGVLSVRGHGSLCAFKIPGTEPAVTLQHDTAVRAAAAVRSHT
jgi:hypothetical protein